MKMVYSHLSIEEQKKTELASLDFCKTVLMLLIVFYHSIVVFRTAPWKEFDGQDLLAFDILTGWLNTIHVPTFVLISGYIFAYLKYEANRYGKFSEFVGKKLKRLIIPYAFVSFVWLIPIDIITFDYDINTIVSNYVLGLAPSQLWFLPMLFWVFIIMYFIADLVKNKPLIAYVSALAIWLVTLIINQYVDNYFQILIIGCYMFIFVCGMLMRIKGTTYLRKLPCWLYLAIDVLFFLLYYVITNTGLSNDLLVLGWGYATQILGAVVGFIVLTSIEYRFKLTDWLGSNRAFVFFKNNSFTIYLFHEQVIYITLMLFADKLPVGLLILLNTVCALTVSSVIAILLNRYKATRVLIGSR